MECAGDTCWFLLFLQSPVFSSLIALLGVILGFCLGEGSRCIREHRRIQKGQKIIREELRYVRKQVQLEQETLYGIQEKLDRYIRVKPFFSPHARAGFDTLIGTVLPSLTEKERNALIYIRTSLEATLREINDIFVCADKEVTLQGSMSPKTFLILTSTIDRLLRGHYFIEKVVDSYIDGVPIDVPFSLNDVEIKKIIEEKNFDCLRRVKDRKEKEKP